ncbi:response regulator [archaeon]|nr:MAG: response regulator [archaeon]
MRETLLCVLMDAEMPVLHGYQATRVLRHIGVPVPIIGVSGNVHASDVTTFLQSGAAAFVPKPINVTQLVTEIERQCDLHA